MSVCKVAELISEYGEQEVEQFADARGHTGGAYAQDIHASWGTIAAFKELVPVDAPAPFKDLRISWRRHAK